MIAYKLLWVRHCVRQCASMLRTLFSQGGFNRSLCGLVGASVGYAFTNPDADTAYDIFPVQKPPPFAFVSAFNVEKHDLHTFEKKWKDVARFMQAQDGYLFTKLHKADAEVSEGLDAPLYQYIDEFQFTTADAHRRAILKPEYQELVSVLPGRTSPSLMYSVVVDDTPKV